MGNKCQFCNNEMKSTNSKTCSRICSDALKKANNREFRKCKVCKNDFEVKKTIKKEMCSDDCRKKWSSIPENKEKRLQSSFDAVFEKYGVKSTLLLNDVIDKTKQTKKEKYGNENYLNHEKAKQTKKEKYGNENFNNIKKIQETKQEKYGDENFNNKDKTKKTIKDKYGVDHPLQLEEFINKQKDTLLKNWGVTSPLKNKEILQKVKDTNLKLYGKEFHSQSESIKNKVKMTYEKNMENTKYYKMYENLYLYNLELIGDFKGIIYKSENKTRKYIQYNFKCHSCDTKFKARFTNGKIPICRTCFPTYKENSYQIILREIFKKNNLSFIENTKDIIKPFELDFYFEKEKIAIEINGNYYHSELGGEKDKNYHLNKTLLCNKKGIRLIQIFEDELENKLDIIISKILSIFSKTENKIFARKCIIKHVSKEEKEYFLNNNHIQGTSKKDSIFIGLYDKENLVSIMTFKKENDDYELTRFCSIKNHIIIGSFSKLLIFFIKNHNPNFIKTFADLRWSDYNFKNTVYLKNGFYFDGYIKPRYWYFKKGNYTKRYHRFSFNKNKLILLAEDKYQEWMDEWIIAQTLGMDRIWDCGYIKFIYKNQ